MNYAQLVEAFKNDQFKKGDLVDAVVNLLNERKDPAQRLAILKLVDKQKRNALMLAASYRPEKVKELLEFIRQLEPLDSVKIRLAHDMNNDNALNLAAYYKNPQAITDLLEAHSESLSEMDLAQKQADKYGNNALMIALASDDPKVAVDSAKAIFEALSKMLPPEEKHQSQTLLTKINTNRRSALLIAASNRITDTNEGVVDLFKTLFKDLTLTEKLVLLTHNANREDDDLVPDTVLYHAVSHKNPHFIEFLFNSIQFDPIKSSKEGDLAMKLIRHCRHSVLTPALDRLEIMKYIPAPIIDDFLDHYYKIFSLATKDRHMRSIASSKELDLNTKYKLLNHGLNEKLVGRGYGYGTLHSYTAANNSEVFRVMWEKDIKDLLEQLRPKDSKEKELTSSEPSAVMILHNDLQTALDKFLESNRIDTDLNQLNTSWKTIINRAYKDKALKGWPEAIATLKTAILMLSVFGLIYLIYEASQQKEPYRSHFFPSKVEAIVNKLQERKDTIAATDETKESKILKAAKEIRGKVPPYNDPQATNDNKKSDSPPPFEGGGEGQSTDDPQEPGTPVRKA